MNTTLAKRLGCSLLAASAIGMSACGLSKPYPDKQLYALELSPPQSISAASPSASLRVLRVRIAEPYSNREFQYLIAPNQIRQDYYANFVADPDQLLTTQVINWLASTGLYVSVVDASSSVKTEQSLQCVVSQLYGDMSDATSPKAVFAARFFLLDETDVDARVLFSRDYKQVEPVDGAGADRLTRAWGRAMQRSLEQLVTDLRVAHLVGTPK